MTHRKKGKIKLEEMITTTGKRIKVPIQDNVQPTKLKPSKFTEIKTKKLETFILTKRKRKPKR